MTIPRVLVAMPTRGTACVASLQQATALAGRFGGSPRFEIGGPVDRVRAAIVRAFLDGDSTHLLMMDDDIVAPVGAVERLLALDAPVAAGLCPIFVDGRFVLNATPAGSDAWLPAPRPDAFAAAHVGLGFTLVRREVFARIRPPWFAFGVGPTGHVIGEDVWFSNRVREAALDLACDGSILCSHLKDGVDLLALAGWR